MTKIDVNKVELVWPGKYNDDGALKEVPRVNLPFQIIERVNESRATREARKKGQQLSLFDVWEGDQGETFEEGWRNKLIWGDNQLVMGSLLQNVAGKIDLIYIDPPFATGADFSVSARIGETDLKLLKNQSVIEEKVYRDTWGKGRATYLLMLSERIPLMKELLSEHGSIYVHADYRMIAAIRHLMDEAFGADNLVNEVIWYYKTGGMPEKLGFGRKHENILFYAMNPEKAIWNPQKEKSYLMHKYGFSNIEIHTDERGDYTLVNCRDVFDIPALRGNQPERVEFPTQKPEALLERIVYASSSEAGIVADFFCGSGTTLTVAEKLDRRWIGCDLSRYAIHVARKRLLEIEGCKPFEILNLGKYERQYWQVITFEKKGGPEQQALYDYMAFILRLYGAQPVSGMQHLHGKKGRALVHVGAVNAPVTIDEVNQALEECVELKQKELHLLGWEWEMGLNDLMVREAKRQGVKLLLLQIPREVMEQQAVDKGDIQFFELAYLDVEIQKPKKKFTIKVELKDFVIPNTELIPEEVRDKVKKWSDYIDYWAVDWNFQEDTFIQGWVAYRTRKERKLPLKSDPHTYEKPGTKIIVVKVIDIFGNDTTQAFEVKVK